ncbi:MAG: hypothetical protein GX535_15325 [Xanthomonadaceae bacterium]|nr:hypothetical protein [Xanthomonadaceae bacterium]
MTTNELLQQFESGDLDPHAFDHRAHIAAAVVLLRQAPYLEAVERYVAGIRRLAAAAGVPHKFNMTVTVAFMSVIAERLEADPNASESDFLERHPDLLAPNFLLQWYDPTRLGSATARRVFLMPEAR